MYIQSLCTIRNHTVYSAGNAASLVQHTPTDSSRLSIRELHNRPFTTPGPLAGLVAAAAGHLAELLVLAGGETDDDIGLAGAEGEDAHAGLRAHGADGRREGSGGVPGGLSLLDVAFMMYGVQGMGLTSLHSLR